MRSRPGGKARTGLKIAVALACSLLGTALLPVLALPYGNLDWMDYDPAYKAGHSFPRPVQPLPQPGSGISGARGTTPASLLAAHIDGQGSGVKAFECETVPFRVPGATSGAGAKDEAIQDRTSALCVRVLDRPVADVMAPQAAGESESRPYVLSATCSP